MLTDKYNESIVNVLKEVIVMLINTATYKNYMYPQIDTQYDQNSGGNKNNREHEKPVEDTVNLLRNNNDNKKELQLEQVLISRQEVEQILFLAVKGVQLKSVHNNVGYHINATA